MILSGLRQGWLNNSKGGDNLSGEKKVVKKKIGELERTKYVTGKPLSPEEFEQEQQYMDPKKRKHTKKKPGKAKKV